MATDHEDDLDRDDGLPLEEGDNENLQHEDAGGDASVGDLGGDAGGADEDLGDGGDGDGEGDDELVISFGDGEQPPARGEDSPVIRKVREENRRLAKENAELRRATAPPPIALGPRPTLESCEYDEEKFATEHEAWIGRKATADAEQTQQRQALQREQQAFQDDLAKFGRNKAALKVKDFDEAEAETVADLSHDQQAIIILAADDAAKVIYALGKHPQKRAELKKITDPVKFTAAIVKLEGSLKVTTRRQAPAPDRSVRGSASFSAASGKVDQHLDKLEREAERSGDRTKINDYKRELRDKERAKARR